MVLLSEALLNSFERDLFNELRDLFLRLEGEYFKELDKYSYLPIGKVGEFAEVLIDDLIGEPLVLKYSHIPNMFKTLSSNLTQVAIKSATALDAKNKTDIVSGKLLEDLQKKALHFRRWKIVTNATSRTVKKRIKSSIDRAIAEKKDYRGLREEIESTFRKYNKGEANNTRTIARTELYSVVRHTEHQYTKKFQKEFKIKLEKRWLTRYDEKVRALHNSYQYKTAGVVNWIPYDDYFYGAVKGRRTRIRYPHDHRGIAADVINCRCRLRVREAKRKRK